MKMGPGVRCGEDIVMLGTRGVLRYEAEDVMAADVDALSASEE